MQITPIQAFEALNDLTPRKLAEIAVRKCVSDHMEQLEQRLALERMFPDWSAEGERAFEKLENTSACNMATLANLLAEQLHPQRYAALVAGQEADAEKRMAEFAEQENAARA
jgi:hypothetical protein